MIKNDLRNSIYLYNVTLKGYTHKFPSLNDCLKFIACSLSKKYESEALESPYLSNLNMGNDYSCFIEPINLKNCSIEKSYMFMDDYNRIIDIREYVDKIFYFYETNNLMYINEWKKVSKWYKRFQKTSFIFRVDPVPHTSSRYRGRSLRSIKTFNECRQNNDRTIEQYIRPKRKSFNLPSSWDDFRRCKSHSWKDCTKKKRQWM